MGKKTRKQKGSGKRKPESWSNSESNGSNMSKKGRLNNTNNNARANKTRRVLAIVGREATTQRWGSNIVHPLKQVVKGDDEFDNAQIKTSTHDSGLTRAMLHTPARLTS